MSDLFRLITSRCSILIFNYPFIADHSTFYAITQIPIRARLCFGSQLGLQMNYSNRDKRHLGTMGRGGWQRGRGGIFDRAWGMIIMEYPIKNSNRTLSESLDGIFPMKLLRTIKRHQLVRLSLRE